MRRASLGPVTTMKATVTDPDDPRLDPFTRLTDRAGRRDGLCIVEGALAVERLADSTIACHSVLVTPNRASAMGPTLDQLDAPVLVVDRELMATTVGFDLHRGIVAAAHRPEPPPVADLVDGARRLLVLEGIADHENLGMCFRNAAAFGVDAVLASPTCADPFYRRCIRVSMGHVLRIPTGTIEPWPRGLMTLATAGVSLAALTPTGERTVADLDTMDAGTRPVAVMVGSEGPGLTRTALEASHRRLAIPMAPGVDSINVATAAAIALHHLAGPQR